MRPRSHCEYTLPACREILAVESVAATIRLLFPPSGELTVLRSCLTFACLLLTGSMCPAGDWPQFRGPDGEGHSAETNLPLTWSETEHVAWKAELPGLGWSSPSIVGKQIWLTTATDEGHSLRVLCVDRDSGKVLHDVEVFHKDEPGNIHKKNSYASPTPLIEGDRVYLHYGMLGTACVSTSREILWTTVLKYNHRHGPAGSPVLFGDLLILNCDGTDVQYVVALDKLTGKEVWRTDREGKMAYATPLIVAVDGKPQLISPGGEWVQAYDPATGKEIWRVRYPGGYSVVPRPVVGHGLTFVSSSYDSATLYAIRLGGEGDVTDSHVAWKLSKGAPHNPSTLLVGDELYVVSDKGILTCLDAKSGEQHYQERLGGNFSASPLFADGRIYLLDEDGKCTVIAPGKEYKVLAENQLPGRTLASISTADGALFLRTDTALYRLQK